MKSCESCNKHAPAPTRSRITGMRATNFGDLWFIDHVGIRVDKKIIYEVLVLIDAASNLVWARAQPNKLHDTTIDNLDVAIDDLHEYHFLIVVQQ